MDARAIVVEDEFGLREQLEELLTLKNRQPAGRLRGRKWPGLTFAVFSSPRRPAAPTSGFLVRSQLTC